MSEKFTQGEWTACGDGDCRCGEIWSVARDIPIAQAYNKYESEMLAFEVGADEQHANAKLIAAAPKLYMALLEARTDMEGWAGYADEYFREKHNLKGDLEKIDAILAEARGEMLVSNNPA